MVKKSSKAAICSLSKSLASGGVEDGFDEEELNLEDKTSFGSILSIE